MRKSWNSTELTCRTVESSQYCSSESLSAEATGRSVNADFVVETVSNISSFLQELLGTSAGASSSTSTKCSHEDDRPSVNFATGASFMALAIAAILVVLLKRA